MANRILRLLIVDDEESIRDMMEYIFSSRTDISLTIVESSKEAIKKVETADFDLVLLDMRMRTETEGLDVLSTIKNLKPRTSVMMITAYGDIPKSVEAMNRGAKDFIEKGLDFEQRIKLRVNDFICTTQLIADRELLIGAKYQEAKRTKNVHKKGKALEELIAALIASIEGFTETGRNVNTTDEEIDIVFRNESRDAFWQKESGMILFECKNWHSQRVGKNEFGSFIRKIESRSGRCKLGFLICMEDFAETIQSQMLRSSRDDILVVPINGSDLQSLIESIDRNELLKKLVEKATLI